MKKVVKIDNYRDKNMWKIEGEAFQEIKAISDEFDRLKEKNQEIMKQLNEEITVVH